MQEKNHNVLVYGTLKRGYGNHRLLEHAKYLGTVVTQPKFKLYDLGFFPGAAPEGNTAIHGELFEVTNAEFQTLDRLEGYPELYTRTRINIPGRKEKPWIYLINSIYEDTEELPEGFWPKQKTN